MENKRKHLEFIQKTIARMASYMFFLKGWAITSISACFLLLARGGVGSIVGTRSDIGISYVWPLVVFVFVFWFLDGYFLFQERLYRALYDRVRKKMEKDIDFSMDASKCQKGGTFCLVFRAMFSLALFPIYLPLLIFGVLLVGFL